jgi:predicted negative regulator of RcsB-dependent stress response
VTTSRYDKRVLFQAAMLLAVPVTIILAVGMFAGWRYLEDTQNDHRMELQEAFRSFVCLAQNNTLTSRQRTDAEKERIVVFYTNLLHDLGQEPCPLPGG